MRAAALSSEHGSRADVLASVGLIEQDVAPVERMDGRAAFDRARPFPHRCARFTTRAPPRQLAGLELLGCAG